MSLSQSQIKFLAIAPKVSGLLSMAGSLFIIRDVATSSKKRKSVFHRVLMGLSCTDLWISFCYFLSTWPIPRDTEGVWGASGTTATCALQGAAKQFGIALPIYSGSLAVYYVFVACFEWDEARIKHIVEPFFHGIPLVFGLVTSITGLPLTLYNSANFWCWIAPYPPNCMESYQYGADGNCERGDNAWIYRLVFWYIPAWIVIFVATGCMIAVYWSVLQKERAADQFNARSGNPIQRKRSGRVAIQASLYIFSFYVAYLPTSVARLLQFFGFTWKFPLLIIVALLTPIQGFFNGMVYILSQYARYKRSHPKASVSRAVWWIIFKNKRIETPEQVKGQEAKGQDAAGGANPERFEGTLSDTFVSSAQMVEGKTQERFTSEFMNEISEQRSRQQDASEASEVFTQERSHEGSPREELWQPCKGE